MSKNVADREKEERKTAPVAVHRPARKRVEELVVPTFSIKSIEEGQSIFIKIIAPLTTKEQIDAKTGKPMMDGDVPKTITTTRVVDIDTGISGEMVCPFMLVKGLESFKGDYVGQCFEMVKGQKKGRTNEWFVYRIEED